MRSGTPWSSSRMVEMVKASQPPFAPGTRRAMLRGSYISTFLGFERKRRTQSTFPSRKRT